MYATLILSSSPYGVRQTAVIPSTNGTRVFNRIGFGRGLAATWYEEWPAEAQSELVLNQPYSLMMTAAHQRDSNIMQITPNNVLQALGKRVDQNNLVPSGKTLADVYAEVLDYAENDPAALRQFLAPSAGTQQSIPQPATPQPSPQPVPQPAPMPPAPETQPQRAETEPDEMPAHQPTVTSTSRDLHTLTTPEQEPYFERTFEDIPETRIYDVARDNQQSVLLTGDAGTGKTSSARNYAAQRGLPFVVIECTQQIDNTVTQGRFVPAEDGNSAKWVYSQLASAIQQPSVILFNELTRMHPKSASLFLRLLAERELHIDTFNETIKVHDECLFIADQNTGIGYNGTMRQDQALLDRFNIKLPFTYDAELEKNFLPYPALLGFATGIRKAADMGDEDFSVPMSTRLLQNFVQQASQFNWEFAVQRLLSNFPNDNGERDAIKMKLDSDAPAIRRDLGVPESIAKENA